MITKVYMVRFDDGNYMRSGRNFTVATFENYSVAKRWAKEYDGVVVRIKEVEEVI